jgi:hypothetical protein
MIRSPLSIIIGVTNTFGFATSAVTWIINASYVRDKKLRYEVFSCSIIGNSTYQKNGPWLCSGSEKENSMLPENAIPESTMSNIEQTNPFGPV